MFQSEPITILLLTFPKVAHAMWWVAQAMWSGSRRLCGGFCENNAKLSSTKFELEPRLSLAKSNQAKLQKSNVLLTKKVNMFINRLVI